jgi:hypothetical protein
MNDAVLSKDLHILNALESKKSNLARPAEASAQNSALIAEGTVTESTVEGSSRALPWQVFP